MIRCCVYLLDFSHVIFDRLFIFNFVKTLDPHNKQKNNNSQKLDWIYNQFLILHALMHN